MHHVLERRPGSSLGPKLHPFIWNLRPDAERFQAFGPVGLDKEVVAGH
jgi:hypothetical protein